MFVRGVAIFIDVIVGLWQGLYLRKVSKEDICYNEIRLGVYSKYRELLNQPRSSH